MRAIDTNILVYAAIKGSLHHEVSSDLLKILAEDPRPWALPWPCIYEFLRVTTHPRLYRPPMSLDDALVVLEEVTSSPSVRLLSETSRHTTTMLRVLRESAATGNLIHDARIVALCLEHGVKELITGDRDFARFSGLTIVNPFSA